MQERQNGRYINRGSEYYRLTPTQDSRSTSPPAADKPQTAQPVAKRSYRVALITIVILAAILIPAVYIVNKNQNPLPRSIANQVTFPVYLPNNSRGVTIDRGSYSFQEGALTYTARTPDNSQVFLSEQAVPKTFDLTTFLQHIKNKHTLTNAYGQGQAGISENNLVISEIIGDTWIFISGPINMKPEQLVLVFQSLEKL
jgi:hypothetical protein